MWDSVLPWTGCATGRTDPCPGAVSSWARGRLCRPVVLGRRSARVSVCVCRGPACRGSFLPSWFRCCWLPGGLLASTGRFHVSPAFMQRAHVHNRMGQPGSPCLQLFWSSLAPPRAAGQGSAQPGAGSVRVCGQLRWRLCLACRGRGRDRAVGLSSRVWPGSERSPVCTLTRHIKVWSS